MSSATHPGPSPAADDLSGWRPRVATGVIVLADGAVIEGFGVGATGSAVGEVCFNTAMTGYEEILTDPSYAAQIITFTFPHIGIVGVNDEDVEVVNAASASAAVGAVMRADVAGPSNFRARARLDSWMKARGIVGVTGVDTRALTTLIRERGMPNAVIAHSPDGAFDLDALRAVAAAWPGIDGMDLVPAVGSTQRSNWDETSWTPEIGYGRRQATRFHVVAIDYGTKRNILRLLNDCGCAVTVVPATASAEDILALRPDGVVLTNGPGRSRRRPANTPCRQFRASWRRRRPCSASASAISSSGLRSAAAPSRWPRAIMAPTIRSRTSPPARLRSCR